jgi:hypothetical protein
VFLISFTLSSANFLRVVGEPQRVEASARVQYNGSTTSPSGPPATLYPSTAPIKTTCRWSIRDALHCIINLSEQNPNALGESLGSD